MNILIIKSLLDQRDRYKVEKIIKNSLDFKDFDKLIVINETEKDYLIMEISEYKFNLMRSRLSKMGVLLHSSHLKLDDILDKINDFGIESLLSYEKKYLDEYKRIFR